jgi:hypothetical protein
VVSTADIVSANSVFGQNRNRSVVRRAKDSVFGRWQMEGSSSKVDASWAPDSQR